MSSTKILIIAAATCFLFAFVVPTVAISIGEDTTSDDVVLESTSQYASTEGEQLRLDLEALNNRAITTADDVFTITINDDAVEQVWMENDVEGLEFYENNDPTAEITESSPLEPSDGDTIHVGVAVDTHVAHAGTETFTVHVRYEDESGGSGGGGDGTSGEPDDSDPDDNDDSDDGNESDGTDDPNDGDGSDENETGEGVTLESVTVTPTALEAGETITAEATYRNEGSEPQRHTAKLTVDGTVVDGRTVELGPGERRTVAFEREMQWPGSYDVGIDGAASERVTVSGPAAEVAEATVSDGELTRGDRTTVSATVRNPTTQPVERTLEFAVDGIVVDTRTVVVRPGSEQTVSFDREFDAPGTYDLSISGVDAGSVTVSEPDPWSLRDRELSAATTAALAPPLTMGVLFLGIAANRRWAIVPTR